MREHHTSRATQHKATLCPTCAKQLDASTGFTCDRRPAEGDLSVCAYCTSFLRYGSDLSLHLMTLEEIGNLDDDSRNALVSARRALQEHK